MPQTGHPRRALTSALTGALVLGSALIVLSGCALLVAPTKSGWPTPAATAVLAPTPALVGEPAGSPTPVPPTPTAAVEAAPTPTQTSPAPLATATPLPLVMGMVLGDERGVFWIDPVSGELLPLLAEPLSAAWALHDGRLALVRGRQVEVVDLSSGNVALLATDLVADLAEAQVLWGADGQTLLLVGWVEPDPLSDEPRQEVIFQELRPTGALANAVAYDGPPAMLLGYDAPEQRALLWRPSADGRQLDVLALNLTSGQTAAVAHLDALSEMTLGPGGALAALAQGASGYELVVTNLSGGGVQTLPIEPGTYATQLVWSPDGSRLAFLLRRGELYDPEAEAIGLFVYDLAAERASGPLDAALPGATIVAWAPDGQSIIVRYQNGDTPVSMPRSPWTALARGRCPSRAPQPSWAGWRVPTSRPMPRRWMPGAGVLWPPPVMPRPLPRRRPPFWRATRTSRWMNAPLSLPATMPRPDGPSASGA